ncbi:hypothetical protein EXIGLDRAFT_619737 [Exidia glandulosa HHB12029]|uniref:Cysteine-rich PDZ-binding protein n=1 Tax=Exidia glandulosa HHB12029 TaxID=1314781 RepID=A0A165F275_EXIGL|nr:hypothetical protein EXIGLDRAFT_619737 [Exidia glandulosa HHB12029]
MVCTKCTKKLSKVAAPDPFAAGSSSSRRVGENKLAKPKYKPYARKCKDCKQTVTQNDAKYCHGCAYKKGLCAICGKAILDTSMYTMSAK